MRLIIINGPNLNLLGKRETGIYGEQSFDDYLIQLRKDFPNTDIEYFQSNSEAQIIEKLHEVGFTFDGIIINGGAYSHTSIAISDAIRSIDTSVIEVHISNVFKRESYRHHSYLTASCSGLICGFGLKVYQLAVSCFIAN